MTALWVVLAMIVAACSGDDALGGDPVATGTDSLWVSLRVTAPAQPALVMRASNDHGTVEEFAVKDAILVLFKNSTDEEATAEVWRAYKITEGFKDDGLNSITQSTHVVQSLSVDDDLLTSDILYALVLLNGQGQFTVDSDQKLKVGGADWTGKTLSDFQSLPLTSIGNTTNGFFMSNAPVKDLSSSDITTLVKVTNVFVKEHQAKSSDGTTVMVERAAAKITLDPDIHLTTGITVNGNTANKLKVHSVEWAVAKRNQTSRAVRPAPSDPTLVDSENAINNQQRTMWTAPYDADYTSTRTGWMKPGDVCYVGERTASVADDATCIVLKVTFKDASNVIVNYNLYGTEGGANVTTTIGGTEYTNGVMYYTYPITHVANTHYGVVRDNIYRLKLSELTKIGKNTEP